MPEALWTEMLSFLPLQHVFTSVAAACDELAALASQPLVKKALVAAQLCPEIRDRNRMARLVCTALDIAGAWTHDPRLVQEGWVPESQNPSFRVKTWWWSTGCSTRSRETWNA